MTQTEIEQRIRNLNIDIQGWEEELRECEQWLAQNPKPFAWGSNSISDEDIKYFASKDAEHESVRYSMGCYSQYIEEAEDELEELMEANLWYGVESLPVIKGSEYVSDYI